MDAVVHLLDRDGWKVDDVFVLTADGRRLDPPMSLVAEVGGAAGPGGRTARAGPTTRAWYENPANQRKAAFGVYALLKSGGLKYVGGLVLLVGGGLWAWLRRTPGTARSSS
jgi:hypothetical protein